MSRDDNGVMPKPPFYYHSRFWSAHVIEDIGYCTCNLIDAIILFGFVGSRKGYKGLAWWWMGNMQDRFYVKVKSS